MALNIDMNNITESTGSSSNRLPNGPYVCKIIDVDYQAKDSWGNDQDYMTMTWDIAEGPHADALSKRPNFTHQSRVSFNPKRLGFSKHILNSITRSNKGFDATEAWKCVCDLSDPHHDQAVKAFEGKLFGANIVTFHKPNNGKNKDRYPDATSEVIQAYYDADEIRAGKDKDGKEITPLPDAYKQGYTPQMAAKGSADNPVEPEVADDDLPF